MDEKAAREAFRVRQYSGQCAGLSGCKATSSIPLETGFSLDTSRCIIHFDVDAFYAQVRMLLLLAILRTCAIFTPKCQQLQRFTGNQYNLQVEEMRDPRLRDVPMGEIINRCRTKLVCFLLKAVLLSALTVHSTFFMVNDSISTILSCCSCYPEVPYRDCKLSW